MIKSFLKIFGILFILLFQFTGCVDNDYNKRAIYYFYDEPVVVDQTGKYPFIRNEYYSFYVPGLADNSTLKEGDLLWSSFIVDMDDKDYPLHFSTFNYTAKSFHYETVDSAKVIIPANVEAFQSYLSDDYSVSIEFSVLYRYVIDNLWFFCFRQKDQSNYTYELILNPEIENGNNHYPTLYIRSKKLETSGENVRKAQTKDGNIFAFDVSDFVDYYRRTISSTGKVHFNLKYKIDVDAQGKDIYRSFMSNPISWNFNTIKPQ
jgi:hypothetical protein